MSVWIEQALALEYWRKHPVVPVREPAVSASRVVAPWQPSTLPQIGLSDLSSALWPETELAPISRREAMSVPAVVRARTIICSSIARLPIRVRPADWSGPTSLIEQPEADRPRFSTLRDTVDDLLFHGSAVWLVTDRQAPSNGGRPVRVRWLPRTSVQESPDPGIWTVDSDVGQVQVPASELIWFDGPHDGLLVTGARAIRAAVRLDRAAARRAINPVPAAELHQTTSDPITDEEIAQLVAAWEKALSGGSGVAFTNSALELRTHGTSPEQLLLQGRNLAAVEIARLAGVPSMLLDAVTPGFSSTYQSVAEQGRALVDNGLSGYMAPIAGRLSMDDVLPRGVWCQFDTDPLTRLPLKERMEGYAAGISAGILTAEECRRIELGRDPLEETS